MTKTCKIYWDDLSYQLSDPDNSFSIINEQGKPYSINWDNNQEHIINNPDNYSYSIKSNATYFRLYVNHPTMGKRYALLGSGQLSFSELSGGQLFKYSDHPNGMIYYKAIFWGYFFSGYVISVSGISSGISSGLIHSSGSRIFTSFIIPPREGIDIFYNVSIVEEPYMPTAYILKIIDNGITYIYPIIDKDSINIINSDPSFKIEIEGHQFDIIDVKSARKDCTEQCPPDTITCDCGNERCCYKPVEYGYKLVKTIILD